MSRVHILPVTGGLVDGVVSHLAGLDAGLEQALVVFPGKRPSHMVRKALAERRGSAFIPPLLLSYDEFIQHLAREHCGIDGRELDRLDAAALLYEIHSGTEKLGGEYFSSFDQFLPLGFRLFDELEELLLAGMTAERIREELGGLAFGNRHLLSRYYDQFYAVVRKRGLLTRSTRLAEVARRAGEIDTSGYTLVLLAGFYALTPVDQRLFRTLAARDRTILLFQEGPGLKKQIEWLGETAASSQMDLFTDASEERRTTAGPQIHLYKSTDRHGQVFAMSAQLKALLDRGEKLDERTVIVLPSPEALFPVLYQALALLDEEGYNVSLGYPLARTPLYGLLANLLDLASTVRGESVHAGAYIRFVLHPYVKNIRFNKRTDVTRVLFHSLEELLARQPLTAVDLTALESEHRLFERIAGGLSFDGEPLSDRQLKEHLKTIHDRLVRPFLKPGTLGEFAARVTELVLFVNNESTAYRHPLFARYAEKLLDLAEGIRASEAAQRRFDDPASYALFLRNYVGPQAVPFPGTPLRGLQVLGLLETRALSFERVFVLDASDDVLPGARGTEMLVPQRMRERLGLETYRDRERLVEYYLHGLMEGAREVHLFFPENDKHQRSRFIEKILWNRSQQPQAPQEPVGTIRYRIQLAQEDPAEIAKTEEVKALLGQFEFNATALDVYLRCQLRFYYHYVLGLREREEVREDIEQLDVGNLIHRILKAFFEPCVGRALRAGDLHPDALRQAIDTVFDQTFGSNQTGAVHLFKQQTISKLSEFLEDYQHRVLENQTVEILGLEQTVSVIRDGVPFTGRIDRLERRGDGKIHILDYKIRQDDTPHRVAWKKFAPDDRKTWSESIGSLQLPMYSLLYAAGTGTEVESVVPSYLFLGRNYIDPSIETGLSKDGIVTREMQENLHRVILALAREIQDPSVPFRPAEDLKRECPGCPYQVMCGTQWAKEGRW